MKAIITTVLLISGLVLGSACSAFTEEAKYNVVKEHPKFELRQYPSRVIAETDVTGAEIDQVDKIGFRRLAGYIFAKKRGDLEAAPEAKVDPSEKIAMTTPVITKVKADEKIPMTTPVITQPAGEKSYRMSFVMPAQYTSVDQLPKPVDPNVRLVQEAPQLVAVHRYSGGWSAEDYEEKKKQLAADLADAGYKTVGEPSWARYNPPWEPWFMKRNEIIWPIEKQK